MKTHVEHDCRSDRRARIEAALAEYPHVDRETLGDLIRWFHTEASPLDVGAIAIHPTLGERYCQLKARHLNRLKGADLFWIAILVILAGIATAAVFWTIV